MRWHVGPSGAAPGRLWLLRPTQARASRVGASRRRTNRVSSCQRGVERGGRISPFEPPTVEELRLLAPTLGSSAPPSEPGHEGNGFTLSDCRTSWTAAELLAAEFPDPRFAVPELIPEG